MKFSVFPEYHLINDRVFDFAYEWDEKSKSLRQLHPPLQTELDAMSSAGHPLRRGQHKQIVDVINPRGSILDVGCGKGEFLKEVAASRPVVGYDIDENCVLDLQAHGYEVYTALPERDFDVVTMFAMLEHCHDPVKTLSYVTQHTHPHSWLVVTIPLLDMMHFGLQSTSTYFQPWHVTYYTMQGVYKLFLSLGWTMIYHFMLDPLSAVFIATREHYRGPMEFSNIPSHPQFLDALARSFEEFKDYQYSSLRPLKVEPCIFWGCGVLAEMIMQRMQLENVVGVVDCDKKKHGLTWRGMTIADPVALASTKTEWIILATETPAYQQEMLHSLKLLGIPRQRVITL